MSDASGSVKVLFDVLSKLAFDPEASKVVARALSSVGEGTLSPDKLLRVASDPEVAPFIERELTERSRRRVPRSLDGRDLSGVPWEKGTPNEPVFIDEFFEYNDSAFAFSSDGKLFQMLPNKDSSLGYKLVPDNKGRYADVMYNGYRITEADAIDLLSTPVES